MKSVPYVDFKRLHEPMRQDLHRALDRVLNHGEFILGCEVADFESSMAQYLGVKHAIGVGNGTDALYLAFKAMGIGVGDEVITPPNSYLASTSSIALAGANPVFVDVDYSMNINTKLIKSAITKKTKAIVAVHLTGNPASMDEILDLATKYNLKVVEDAAQAVGAEYRGKKVGSLGSIGCFSMHPLKNLGALGDAGLIVTNDDQYAEYLTKARNHGHVTRDTCDFWSHNMRLDALQAAFLQLKFSKINEIVSARRKYAKKYLDNLCSKVELPFEAQHSKGVYHTFIIRVENRDELAAYLKANGVDTKVHYPIPIHLQKASNEIQKRGAPLDETQIQAKRILSLPIAEYLYEEEIDRVIDLINGFYK